MQTLVSLYLTINIVPLPWKDAKGNTICKIILQRLCEIVQKIHTAEDIIVYGHVGSICCLHDLNVAVQHSSLTISQTLPLFSKAKIKLYTILKLNHLMVCYPNLHLLGCHYLVFSLISSLLLSTVSSTILA